MRTDLTTIANSLFIRADEGDLEAQRRLLRCYRKGLSVEKNPRHNFQYFLDQTRKSENIFYFSTKMIYPQEYERTAYSMMRLGDFYRYGIDGVEVNQRKAFECYEKAAHQGNVIAKIKTAICFSRGIGVQKNNEEAYKILKQCPLIPDVEFNLGKCLAFELGTQKDEISAFLFIDSAAHKGHANAQKRMAEMLETKEGTTAVRYQKFSIEIAQKLSKPKVSYGEVPEFVTTQNPILGNTEMVYVTRGDFSELRREYIAASIAQGLPFFPPSASPIKSAVEVVKPNVAEIVNGGRSANFSF